MKKNLLLVACLFFVSCVKIPKPYRGVYVDTQSKAQLSLSSKKGKLQRGSELIEAPVVALAAKELLKGKTGIYMRRNPMRKDLLEFYWIEPEFEKREVAENLVWFPARVYYSLLSEKVPEKVVQNIKIIHSRNATVMVESDTGLFQVGWPSGPEELNFERSLAKPKREIPIH